MSPLHDDRRYTCPGDSIGISRVLHLARLAAGAAVCQTCPHRDEHGALRPPLPASRSRTVMPPRRDWLRTRDGFRGIAVNQLDRLQASTWAAALASLLWDEDVRDLLTDTAGPRTPPVIVLGYDERPVAPEVMLGAARGLARMSCRVIDLGLTSQPLLRFAVQHLQADAGLFVTGSGCDPAWIGFDVCRQAGLPPDTAFLDRWQTVQEEPLARPGRTAGSLTACTLLDRYEASLTNVLHALRPLHVVCGTPSSFVSSRIKRLFARLPGRLHTVTLPRRSRDLSDAADPDRLAVGAAVKEQSAHLGVVIEEDGASCSFVDERGQPIPDLILNGLLIQHLLHEEGPGPVILGTDVWDELAPVVTSRGGRPILVAEADRAARLMVEDGLIAVGADHRLWFHGEVPRCDAIITLAMVMQLLSRSDTEFSYVTASSGVRGQ